MAVANPWLRAALVAVGSIACSPQLVDAVSGVSCCDDPSQPGCVGSGGARSSGGGGSAATGGSVANGGSGGTAGSAGASAALVHRYTFQGAGIDVTDSVGSANGNVLNTMLDGTGSVTLMDANPEQYVELPSFILSGLKDATFEAWVTWAGGAGDWQRVFDFGEDVSGIHGVRGKGRSYLFCTVADANGHPKVAFGRPATNSALETTVVANLTIAPGTKTHIAVVVVDKVSISLFVNGGFQGSSKFDFSLDYIYDINSWLGRSIYLPDSGLNGTIHDFRIYNAALDANQILDNYTTGLNSDL